MTVLFTVLAGVLTFVIGQLALILIIEPIRELRRVIADISHVLIQDAQIIWNPGLLGKEKEDEVQERLRTLSSRLNTQMYLIPKYNRVSKIFGLPNQETISKASGHLIGLSNSLHKPTADTLGSKNIEKAQKICRLLSIYIPRDERIDESET